MSNQLDRLESKVDKTIDAMAEVGIQLARMEVNVERNTEDLEEHIEGVQQTRVRLERLEKIEQWLRGAFYVLLGVGSLYIAYLKIIS
jgi:FtsZ-binding cell division protein ZapB